MSDDKLTRWQRAALALAIAGVAAGMLSGIWSSAANLFSAAEHFGWSSPWRLPVAVDAPILAYVILDQIAVTIGARSRWLHYAAWGLAGFTVWANASLAPAGGSTVWRVVYAAMPALWVLGVEALRFFWKVWRNGPGTRADRIPAGRWIANPFTAAWLQRRMWLLSETSWARMSLIEDARQYARDLIRAAEKQHHDVPDMLRSRTNSGRLHETVTAAIDARLADPTAVKVEAAVHTWVASLMVLPEIVSADLRRAAQEAADTTPAEPVSEDRGQPVAPAANPAAQRTRQRTPNHDRKPTAAACRKMTGEQLAPYVAAWVGQGHPASIAKVAEAFKVGEPKAKTALVTAGLWGQDAAVVAIGAR